MTEINLTDNQTSILEMLVDADGDPTTCNQLQDILNIHDTDKILFQLEDLGLAKYSKGPVDRDGYPVARPIVYRSGLYWYATRKGVKYIDG